MTGADRFIEEFLASHVGGLQVVKPTAVHENQLTAALQLLCQVEVEFHAMLVESVRSVSLFTSTTKNSFAAVGIHGMIFLNGRAPTSVPFFLEEWVHQGGHVLFTEATVDRQAYFACDPDAPISRTMGTEDTRTGYEFLHGLFTEYAVLRILKKVRRAERATGQAVELEGRLALALSRFERDLALANHLGGRLLREEGLRLLRNLASSLPLLKHGYSKARFDLSGQSGDFDLKVFMGQNPPANHSL